MRICGRTRRLAAVAVATVATWVAVSPARADTAIEADAGAAVVVGDRGAPVQAWTRLGLALTVDLSQRRHWGPTRTEVTAGVVGLVGFDGEAAADAAHWGRFRYVIWKDGKGGAPSEPVGWVTADYHLSYRRRVELSRRRDRLTSTWSGAEVGLDAVVWGVPDPRDGAAFLPIRIAATIADDVDATGRRPSLEHFQLAALRWWDAPRGGRVPHVREVMSVDGYLDRGEVDTLAFTLVPYEERGRPLLGSGLVVDARAGLATNTGGSIDGQAVADRRHPSLTAGVLDGGLRLVLDRGGGGLRYRRSMFLSPDHALAIEDRATATLDAELGPVSVTAEAFAARTMVWPDRAVERGGAKIHWTDGGSVRAIARHRGFELEAVAELGHSFYATDGALASTPAWGARVGLALRYRWRHVLARGAVALEPAE